MVSGEWAGPQPPSSPTWAKCLCGTLPFPPPMIPGDLKDLEFVDMARLIVNDQAWQALPPGRGEGTMLLIWREMKER